MSEFLNAVVRPVGEPDRDPATATRRRLAAGATAAPRTIG